jgi:amino acid transporter
MPNTTEKPVTIVPRQLGMWDVASITAGIIIGAAIYESVPRIASNVSGPTSLMLMWLAGGVIALIGALCYAELSSAYPHQGGTYVFLNRAFGGWAGFLYAWSEFWIVRPGNIGAMAFIFAKYFSQAIGATALGSTASQLLLAAAAVVLIGGINLFGIRMGKGTQNVLTVVKIAGLVAIFVVGMWPTAAVEAGASAQVASDVAEVAGEPAQLDWTLALVFILFAYGGWNETAAVAAEVHDPQRNMLRGLLLGTSVVVVTYFGVNLALLRTLGFAGIAQGDTVVATAVARILGPWGARAISVSICLSCLGAINGMLFTGARLYYALGVQEPAFAWLGKWHDALGTPTRALALQTVVALVLVAVFGSTGEGFDPVVMFTVPVFWSFLLLVSVAVIVLRLRDRETPRPFRLPFFPLEPVIFFLTSALMIYRGVDWLLDPYHKHDGIYWFSAAATVLSLVSGAIIYLLTRRR